MKNPMIFLKKSKNTYINGYDIAIVANRPAPFSRKGYKSVGVSEILKACDVTKGALYHHFPNGKEELLIACLKGLNEAITIDMEDIFKRHSSTQEATQFMLNKLTCNLETEGKLTGYTFSSIVSEMATVSEPVRQACNSLYENIQTIYYTKLVTEGFSNEAASDVALLMTTSIEGAIMLCQTQQSTASLKTISKLLPTILKG